MHWAMVGAAALLVAFDFQNLLSWWRGRTISLGDEECWDFTVIVPVFGHPRYFGPEYRRSLERYRWNVVVALEVTAPLMGEFADELERGGWRVRRLRLADPNPGALVREALASVRTTTYALRLDADTRVDDRLPRAVMAVARSGADICSVKVEAEVKA